MVVQFFEEEVCFYPSTIDEEGACVVKADIAATNGVAHVVDDVLSPYYFYYAAASLAAEFQAEYELSSLAYLLGCSGLGTTVDDTFGITVLAPVDVAFSGLDVDYYCGDGVKELQAILAYHVIPKVVPSTSVYTGYFPTLNGDPVKFEVGAGGDVYVDGANVIATDLLAYNGVIHIIDQVSVFGRFV